MKAVKNKKVLKVKKSKPHPIFGAAVDKALTTTASDSEKIKRVYEGRLKQLEIAADKEIDALKRQIDSLKAVIESDGYQYNAGYEAGVKAEREWHKSKWWKLW